MPINPLVGAGLISAGSNLVGGLFGAGAQINHLQDLNQQK